MVIPREDEKQEALQAEVQKRDQVKSAAATVPRTKIPMQVKKVRPSFTKLYLLCAALWLRFAPQLIEQLQGEKLQVEKDFASAQALSEKTQIESERRRRALELAHNKIAALENALHLSNKQTEDMKQAANDRKQKYEQT